MNQLDANSLLQRPTKSDPCVWSQDDSGAWYTSCGEGFDLTTADCPEEAGLKFCCYCGKPIESIKYSVKET